MRDETCKTKVKKKKKNQENKIKSPVESYKEGLGMRPALVVIDTVARCRSVVPGVTRATKEVSIGIVADALGPTASVVHTKGYETMRE